VRVALATLSDGKLIDVASIVQLTINIAHHLKVGTNLPLGLEQNIEAAVGRMKELSRTVYCGADKEYTMMEYAWAGLVSEATTLDAAAKSEHGIDARRLKQRPGRIKFFKECLTMLKKLRASYRYQLADDVEERVTSMRSAARSNTETNKRQCCSDVNGLLGLRADPYSTTWHVWKSAENPYAGVSTMKFNTHNRITASLLKICKAEKAAAIKVTGMIKDLLCAPSVAQLARLAPEGVKRCVGNVMKRVNVPKSLHAIQATASDEAEDDVDAEGFDDGDLGTLESASRDSSAVIDTAEEIDLVYGLDHMEIPSGLLRAERRDAISCEMEAGTTELAADGALMPPMHLFTMQDDYDRPGFYNAGELQCTMVVYDHNGAYHLGALRVPTVIPDNPTRYEVRPLAMIGVGAGRRSRRSSQTADVVANMHGVFIGKSPHRFAPTQQTQSHDVSDFAVAFTCPCEYRTEMGSTKNVFTVADDDFDMAREEALEHEDYEQKRKDSIEDSIHIVIE
jgi:hypothetical protein